MTPHPHPSSLFPRPPSLYRQASHPRGQQSSVHRVLALRLILTAQFGQKEGPPLPLFFLFFVFFSESFCLLWHSFFFNEFRIQCLYLCWRWKARCAARQTAGQHSTVRVRHYRVLQLKLKTISLKNGLHCYSGSSFWFLQTLLAKL